MGEWLHRLSPRRKVLARIHHSTEGTLQSGVNTTKVSGQGETRTEAAGGKVLTTKEDKGRPRSTDGALIHGETGRRIQSITGQP